MGGKGRISGEVVGHLNGCLSVFLGLLVGSVLVVPVIFFCHLFFGFPIHNVGSMDSPSPVYISDNQVTQIYIWHMFS